MQIKPDQLVAALGRGLAPVYVLAGEESLLVTDAIGAVRAAARTAGYDERVVYEVERGFDWSLLRAQAASLSLFAQRRLIELRLGSGKLTEDGSAALCDYTAALPPDVLLLLTGEAFDKRTRDSAWYAACDRAGVVVYAWPLDAAALPRWLVNRARGQGLSLDEPAATLLADFTEGNLLAAAQELDKLVLLTPPGSALGRDAVLEAVGDSTRYATRDLADAVLAGDRRRLTRALAHLKDTGETPILALWQLTQDLQRLAEGNSVGQPPRRRDLLSRAQRRRSPAGWQGLLAQAALVDRASKGVGSGIEPWQALTALALRMAGPGESPGKSQRS